MNEFPRRDETQRQTHTEITTAQREDSHVAVEAEVGALALQEGNA